jgi:ubiquinone/menaquinone biosynthesis C-methylase UbiE
MSGFESRDWYYNEYQQVGLDFESAEKVENYDDEVGRGISRSDESSDIADALGIKSTDSVLEIGTATGILAIDLSFICQNVYAIDISEPMLECAREKAKKRGRNNVEFIKSGFLTYQHEGNPLDAVITKFSLHHIPDHWKFVAVKRIFDMLKPGGKLYLKDCMISVEIQGFFDSADYWVSGTREQAGDKPADAVVLCIKDEYPIYAWVMEEMLKRVGFCIEYANHMYGLHTTFICSKPV